MQIAKVDLNKLRSIGDKAMGLGKEFVGALIDNEGMQDAGVAQQERATEEMRALKAEMKAEAKETKAAGFEQRQKAAQAAKR